LQKTEIAYKVFDCITFAQSYHLLLSTEQFFGQRNQELGLVEYFISFRKTRWNYFIQTKII